MAKDKRFNESDIRILLEMQEGEHLLCDSCKSHAVEGDVIWVFVPLSQTIDRTGETCCLSCASAIKDVEEPFEVDQ